MVRPQSAPSRSTWPERVVRRHELGVGLAELLDGQPRQAVADQEEPERSAPAAPARPPRIASARTAKSARPSSPAS